MIFFYIFEGQFILALNPVIVTMNEYSVSNPQAMINVSKFMDDLLLLDYFIKGCIHGVEKHPKRRASRLY